MARNDSHRKSGYRLKRRSGGRAANCRTDEPVPWGYSPSTREVWRIRHCLARPRSPCYRVITTTSQNSAERHISSGPSPGGHPGFFAWPSHPSDRRPAARGGDSVGPDVAQISEFYQVLLYLLPIRKTRQRSGLHKVGWWPGGFARLGGSAAETYEMPGPSVTGRFPATATSRRRICR